MYFSVSLLQACLACAGLTVQYVGSLYIWPVLDAHPFFEGLRQRLYPLLALTPEHGNERDHPVTIRKRIYSVTLASLVSPVWLLYFLRDHRDDPSLARTLGLHTDCIWRAMGYPLVLVMVLFCGSVYMKSRVIVRTLSRATSSEEDMLLAVRNYMVAPFSEEFVFRSCMCPLLLASGLSHTQSVLICPLFFSVAHVHHIIRGVRWEAIAIQATYTCIFGWYAGFLFLRTGHFMAPLLAHSFCNVMEFPPFEKIPGRPDKWLCIGLYVMGSIFFYLMLPYLTEPTWYNSMFYVPAKQSQGGG